MTWSKELAENSTGGAFCIRVNVRWDVNARRAEWCAAKLDAIQWGEGALPTVNEVFASGMPKQRLEHAHYIECELAALMG
jgi:hypothetical protein